MSSIMHAIRTVVSHCTTKAYLMTSTDSSRRDFLKTSAYTAGVLGAASQLADAAVPRDAASKIRIGFVGPGGRGFGAHVKRLTTLQVEGQPIELVAVCDVYNEHRDRAAAHIEKAHRQCSDKV